MQSEIMQHFQNQDAVDFEVVVESYNENRSQTFRNFFHSKFMQLKILYQTKRKCFLIGFIVMALIIMNIINMSWKINPSKSNALDASNQVDLIKKATTKKEEKEELFSTELNIATQKYQNTSIEFNKHLQNTEFNTSLLLLEKNTLWLLNLETEHNYFWHTSNNTISAFYINFEGIPIWFEDRSKTTHSLSDNYDKLALPANLKVKAIVDDWTTNNSYALNDDGENLLVIDKYYRHVAIILSNLKGATDLKIDPLIRLVFILTNGQILRCNMDGQKLKILNSLGNDISDFTLDYTSKKLYLLCKKVIEYSDYEGKVRGFFYKLETFNYVTSLTFQNDKLFWLQQNELPNSQSLHYIMYCSVNKKCQMPSKITVPFELSRVIAFPNTSELTIDTNPCHRMPLVCDHICILGANSTYTCVCDQFHILSDDMKSCKLIGHYLIYLHKNSFRGKLINNALTSSNDLLPFLPVYFNLEVYYRSGIKFSKGSEDFEIFFSDNKNIYSINLRTSEQKVFCEIPSDRQIFVLTYDSGSGRLYMLFKYYNNYCKLGICDKEMVFSEHNLWNSCKSEFSSMVLTYDKLLLTFKESGKIISFSSSTSQFKEISYSRQFAQMILLQKYPIDLNSRELNWFDWNYSNILWRCGSELDDKLTIKSNVTLPSVLSNIQKGFIYEENLYVADSYHIWRVQKNSSDHADIIFESNEDKGKIHGITYI